ncbi:MAG: tRNA lysidine(34) synthetase TilS [Oscillospiraceae bacterium]
MLNKVEETIKKYNMIQKSERVMVGLSGGADSVSLLLCLKKFGYNVSACHINHRLRGDESMRDEKFCIDLCKKLNINLEVHRIDVSNYCKEQNCSIEEGARNLRYKIFENADCDKIATAHTLSDSLETTIFNLVRGTGLKGLCSIPPVRDNIIRPLVACTREDVERFLAEESQDFVTDSTNLSVDYSRNKIRHKVIPVFSEMNASLLDTYKNTLENLRNDENCLEILSEELIEKSKTEKGYNAEIISDAHPAIRNRAITKILSQNNLPYSYQRIEDISEILNNGGKINLHNDIFAVCKDGIFDITKCSDHQENKFVCHQVDFQKQYQLFEKEISFNIMETDQVAANVHKKFANMCCDYDKIVGKVLLRNRKNGDKIILCNRNFSSSVKKLLNSSVPQNMRDKIVMLQDEQGLFFIEGFGCADRVKIDDKTKHILICKIS